MRATIATFIDPGAFTGGPNLVFPSTPKIILGKERFKLLAAGQLTAVAAVIHLVGENETRIAFGGVDSGKKKIDYGIVLQMYCCSREMKSEDSMDTFDGVVTALKQRLRSDHTFGTDPSGAASQDGPSRIFQAAEPELDAEYSDPVLLGTGQVEIWGALRFDVSQIIEG